MEDCIDHGYSVGTSGYSNTTVNYKWITRHRKAWQDFAGLKMPSEAVVRHACSNKRCINPHHLTIGTVKDNVEDKIRYKEMPRGSLHPNSKLTEDQVEGIKERLALGEKQQLIADFYGVKRVTITDIKSGKTWNTTLFKEV